MKFNWNMDIKDYKRLQKALAAKKAVEDCYGVVSVGKLSLDIMAMSEYEVYSTGSKNKNVIAFCEFVAGVDDGYGELADGTPYTLIEENEINCKSFKADGTFDEFKTSVEKEYERAITAQNRSELANAEGPDWSIGCAV